MQPKGSTSSNCIVRWLNQICLFCCKSAETVDLYELPVALQEDQAWKVNQKYFCLFVNATMCNVFHTNY